MATDASLQEHLMHEGGRLQPFRTVALRLNITDETIISPALLLLSVQMADQLTIGCYPVRCN